ncbi:aldo/keto reductase [Enterococcus gilvus]|uniref:aldo/keto reductase n=1 Tax=Enterococcus gilvus TaxID=160453 RepID=UPI0028D60BE0|nr:aldo/keto reductase [Enterococcus gilvus]
MLKETYTLTNGVEIPKIGYGTWKIANDQATEKVLEAIEAGYRHIDTAQAYGNEAGVGEAIKKTTVPREELFLTTKLAAEIKDYDGAVKAIDDSLKKLGVDVIDLMIIHSPKPWAVFHGEEHYFEGNLAAWRALEGAYQAGKLRAIGVSNFEIVDLENLLKHSKTKPVVNQVLAHIGQTPFDVIEFSQKQEILVEAYSPIAHGAMLKSKTITALADKYKVSIPQLAIRYCLQLGLLPLPKTENPAHMKNNAEVDFEISDEDMEKLARVTSDFDYGKNNDMPVFRRVLG